MAKGKKTFKVKPKSTKGLKKAILATTLTREKLDDLKHELGKRTHKMVTEQFGTYLKTFEAMLCEHRAMRQLFFEKGFFTRDELNKKYSEIKKKK